MTQLRQASPHMNPNTGTSVIMTQSCATSYGSQPVNSATNLHKREVKYHLNHLNSSFTLPLKIPTGQPQMGVKIGNEKGRGTVTSNAHTQKRPNEPGQSTAGQYTYPPPSAPIGKSMAQWHATTRWGHAGP